VHRGRNWNALGVDDRSLLRGLIHVRSQESWHGVAKGSTRLTLVLNHMSDGTTGSAVAVGLVELLVLLVAFLKRQLS